IVDYSSMLPYGSKSLLLQLLSKNYPLLISPKDYMLLVKVGQIGGSFLNCQSDFYILFAN
ncbi:TPA: hypothetical protein ACGO1D_001591, partial [Streptococcus suis]